MDRKLFYVATNYDVLFREDLFSCMRVSNTTVITQCTCIIIVCLQFLWYIHRFGVSILPDIKNISFFEQNYQKQMYDIVLGFV